MNALIEIFVKVSNSFMANLCAPHGADEDIFWPSV